MLTEIGSDDPFEDDGMDEILSRMNIWDFAPDVFDGDSMDSFLAKMTITDAFIDDGMDEHLALMEIPHLETNKRDEEPIPEDQLIDPQELAIIAEFQENTMDPGPDAGTGQGSGTRVTTKTFAEKKREIEAIRTKRREAKKAQTGDVASPGVVFEVVKKSEHQPRKCKRLNCMEYSSTFEFKHNLGQYADDIFIAEEVVDQIIEEMVTPQLEKAGENDVIILSIDGDKLHNSFYTKYKNKSEFEPSHFLTTIASFITSGRDEILDSGILRVNILIQKGITGHGLDTTSIRRRVKKGPRAPKTFVKRINNSKSFITIVNEDHYCGYLAITLGWLDQEKGAAMRRACRYDWKQIIRGRQTRLRAEMNNLFQSLDVDISKPLNTDKLIELDEKLPMFQIVVVPEANSSARSFEPIYRGTTRDKKIILEHVVNEDHPKGHYNYIRKLHTYYGHRAFCFGCWKGVRNSASHRCRYICDLCGGYPLCSRQEKKIECGDCQLSFFGKRCFNNHKLIKCEAYKKCDKCHYLYRNVKQENHICGVYKCSNCYASYTTSPHYCFIRPLDEGRLKVEDAVTKVIVAFDIETYETEEDESGYRELKANLCISHTVCDHCYDYNLHVKKSDMCSFCGRLQNVFFGDDCIKRFIDYLCIELATRIGMSNSNIFAYAHNFKGFDGRFILQEIYTRKFEGVNMIMTGTKVLRVKIGNVFIQDSASFFQMSLDKCAKSFQDKKQRMKGDFPHLANSPKNYDYSGPMLPMEMYPIKFMPRTKLEEFKRWYNGQVAIGYQFNFKEELIKYCVNDVEILLFSIMQFRSVFKEASGLCPLTRNFTLASIGQEVFRAKIMKPETIGIVPIKGYTNSSSSSAKEMAWLDLRELETGTIIARQKRIGPYVVDGFSSELNTVYEYQGCYWHGCEDCYGLIAGMEDVDRNETLSFPDGDQLVKATMNQRFAAQRKRLETLTEMGYNVEVVWEHQRAINNTAYFLERETKWAKIFSFGNTIIRDSMRGGRTEVFKLSYVTKPGESIRYLDFTSLYPFVLKSKRYPVGHPCLITKDFDVTLDSYFGFVTCTVEPPSDLKFPVLPLAINGQLLFGLCNTCMNDKQYTCCTHSAEKRYLTGTWTTVELKKALSKRYKLVDIHCIHHYQTVADDMFSDYISMWLKLKQESSGWPSEVVTENQQDQYISDYHAREGILLDRNNIERNEGRRLIAKLMLNSFWGKLSQRCNMTKTEWVTSYERLAEILHDDRLKITGHVITAIDTCVVNFEFAKEENSNPGNTSPAIASFVTSYARIELYNLIEEIEHNRDDRMIYCDTDSAIFVERPSDPRIKTGNFLGELTDEFADYPGFKCTKAICPGPKSYVLFLEKNTDTGIERKSIMKNKGVTMCSATDTSLTPENMETYTKSFIRTGERKKIAIDQQQFISRGKRQRMYRREFTKDWRVTSDKRITLDEGNTFPYGSKSHVYMY